MLRLRRLGVARLGAVALVAAALVHSVPVRAQARLDAVALPEVGPGQVALLSANLLTWDRTHQVVTATGEVRLVLGKAVLTAPVLVYDQGTRIVRFGHGVKIVDGARTVTAEHLEAPPRHPRGGGRPGRPPGGLAEAPPPPHRGASRPGRRPPLPGRPGRGHRLRLRRGPRPELAPHREAREHRPGAGRLALLDDARGEERPGPAPAHPLPAAGAQAQRAAGPGLRLVRTQRLPPRRAGLPHPRALLRPHLHPRLVLGGRRRVGPGDERPAGAAGRQGVHRGPRAALRPLAAYPGPRGALGDLRHPGRGLPPPGHQPRPRPAPAAAVAGSQPLRPGRLRRRRVGLRRQRGPGERRRLHLGSGGAPRQPGAGLPAQQRPAPRHRRRPPGPRARGRVAPGPAPPHHGGQRALGEAAPLRLDGPGGALHLPAAPHRPRHPDARAPGPRPLRRRCPPRDLVAAHRRGLRRRRRRWPPPRGPGLLRPRERRVRQRRRGQRPPRPGRAGARAPRPPGCRRVPSLPRGQRPRRSGAPGPAWGRLARIPRWAAPRPGAPPASTP